MWTEEAKRKIADELNERGITLNGKPAHICGIKEKFATVHTLDMEAGLSGEWSWSTLDKMRLGGARTLSI